MKFNNKILTIVFAGLLALLLFQKFVRKPEVRSFKNELVSIDTSSIDKILFKPKGENTSIELKRANGAWQATSNGTAFNATGSSVASLLAPATNIKALQLVAKSQEKWSEYEVDDVNGKKIELYSGNSLQASFYVGRFNFNQNTRSAKTYVRLNDDEDIYVVDGFLSMTYEKKLDDFRNKKLVNGMSTSNISKIEVSSPDYNGYIEKDLNNNWINKGNVTIDSSSVANYLNKIVNLTGNEIVLKNDAENYALIKIEGGSQSQTISIFKTEDNRFFINSSTNSDVFFKSDSTSLFKSAYLDFINIK